MYCLFGLLYGDFDGCGGKVFSFHVNVSVVSVCLIFNNILELIGECACFLFVSDDCLSLCECKCYRGVCLELVSFLLLFGPVIVSQSECVNFSYCPNNFLSVVSISLFCVYYLSLSMFASMIKICGLRWFLCLVLFLCSMRSLMFC